MQAEESLPGYVARVAEANFCESAGWITADLSSRQPNLAFSPAAAEQLAAKTGQCPDVMVDRTYRKMGKRVLVRGHDLPAEAVAVQQAGVCPACLRDEPIRRWWWELTPFGVCPDHRVELVTRCHACGDKYSWATPRTTVCRCGADIRRTETVEVPHARAGTSLLLLNVIRGRPTGFESLNLGPRDLGDWIDLLVVLARLQLFVAGEKSQGPTLRRPNRAAILSSAVELLDDWPTRYFDVLDQVARRTAHIGDSFAGRFRPLYTGLKKLPAGAARDFLTETTTEYLRARRFHIPVAFAPAETFLSRSEAVAFLDISVEKFEAVLDDPGCCFPRYRLEKKAAAFAKSDLERLAEDMGHSINKRHFKARLGLSPRQVKQLLESRYFGGDKPNNAVIDGTKVERLLDQLDAQAAAHREGVFDISFVDLKKKAIARDVPLKAVLEMIESGMIPATGKIAGRSGLPGYLFSRVHVEAALDQFVEDHVGGLYKDEAAKAMRLRLDELMELRRLKGIIAFEHGPCRRPRFSEDEVAKFRAKYVAQRELGLRRSTGLTDALQDGWEVDRAIAFHLGQRRHPVLLREAVKADFLPSES
jgi:hypothetical protein